MLRLNSKNTTSFSVILTFENLLKFAINLKDLYSGNLNGKALIKYLAKCC